jgi:hypothetical protein
VLIKIKPSAARVRMLSSQISCLALVLLLSAPFLVDPASAQTPMNGLSRIDPGSTQAEAAALRDRFVTRLHNAGFTCSLPVPAIVVEDVPSFGQYRPETNVVRTSDWNLLSPQEKAMFVQLAGPGKNEIDAHNLFDVAHQWIFIHELGHWWQACNGGNAGKSHYQVEYGANRISLAYWREVNPQVAETMKAVFQTVVDHAPSPVPPDQSVEGYFNANYETLGPSPKYPWFMSRMNLTAFDEMPVPTFAAAVRSQQRSQ